MPIYEYRCQDCRHELERIQKISDAPLTDCPDCGRASLRRLISAPGFRLKGSGWYETDFKSDNRRNIAESGEKKKDTDATSGDSKPAAAEKSAAGSTPEKPAAKAPATGGDA